MSKVSLDERVKAAIAQFDLSNIDLASIKENILSYSSINMAYGRLRREATQERLPDAGDVNPADAEHEDRLRLMEATGPKSSTPDREAVTRLVALAEEDKYQPFDHDQNIRNALHAAVAISGCLPSAAEFKTAYIGALNAIQNTVVPCRDSVVVSFDNPALLSNLLREGLITPSAAHIFSPPAQERIAQYIGDAFAFINAVDEDLHDMIRLLIGAIAPIQREGSSGTVSSIIGLLWLNPTPDWTVVDYAENIVHEFIHNTIFLSDLVSRIFITPHWYTPKDSLVVSAIKKYPRGVNISYHSVFVAMGLIIFLQKAKQYSRAQELSSGLKETVVGLKAKAPRFLSNFAVAALNQVDVFQPAAT